MLTHGAYSMLQCPIHQCSVSLPALDCHGRTSNQSLPQVLLMFDAVCMRREQKDPIYRSLCAPAQGRSRESGSLLLGVRGLCHVPHPGRRVVDPNAYVFPRIAVDVMSETEA
jgi:hypothetical protein